MPEFKTDIESVVLRMSLPSSIFRALVHVPKVHAVRTSTNKFSKKILPTLAGSETSGVWIPAHEKFNVAHTYIIWHKLCHIIQFYYEWLQECLNVRSVNPPIKT